MLSKSTRVLLLSLAIAGAVHATAAEKAYPDDIAAWTPAEKVRQRANGVEFLRLLNEAIAAQSRTLSIPKDHYRFDNTAAAPIVLANVTGGLAIDFQDSTFWVENQQDQVSQGDLLRLFSCTGIELRNLTVDYDPLPFTQGKIVAINDAASTIEVEIPPAFQTVTPVFAARDANDNEPHVPGSLYDPVTRKLKKFNGFRVLPFFKTAPIRPNVWRVTVRRYSTFTFSEFTLGDLIVMDCRGRPTFEFGGCKNIVVENVTFYCGVLPAIGDVVCEGTVLRNIKMLRRPDTDRLISICADGIHSTASTIGPRIENCHFEYLNDDPINIHGWYNPVYAQEAPNQLVIGRTWHLLPAGGDIDFYRHADFSYLGKRRITAVTNLNTYTVPAGAIEGAGSVVQAFRVTLDQNIAITAPARYSSDDYCGRGSVITGCYFGDSIARGVLLQSCNARIANNTFNNINATPIIIGSEGPGFWRESIFPHDIVVENNTFIDTRADRPGVYTMAGVRMSAGRKAANISITNSTFSLPAQNITRLVASGGICNLNSGGPGDVNGDKVVNARDLAFITQHFNEIYSSATWDLRADANGDGIVDDADLAVVTQNFGKSY